MRREGSGCQGTFLPEEEGWQPRGSSPTRWARPAHPAPQPDPLLGAAQNEEGLNAVLLEVGVALAPTAWLHLVVAIQVVECGLGDVDAPAGREGRRERKAENMTSELQPPCRTTRRLTWSQFRPQGPNPGSDANPNLNTRHLSLPPCPHHTTSKLYPQHHSIGH